MDAPMLRRSEAGQGTGIWGYDVWPGVETSVGWIEYLPAR